MKTVIPNIKKGDSVKILSGKDKGKIGRVIRVDKNSNRISVDGVNVYKKHVRPKRQGEKGEVVLVTRPFNISNASLMCSSCGKNARAAFRFDVKRKVRYCRKCSAEF